MSREDTGKVSRVLDHEAILMPDEGFWACSCLQQWAIEGSGVIISGRVMTWENWVDCAAVHCLWLGEQRRQISLTIFVFCFHQPNNVEFGQCGCLGNLGPSFKWGEWLPLCLEKPPSPQHPLRHRDLSGVISSAMKQHHPLATSDRFLQGPVE